jgi:molecular chaperone GrpE
MSGSTPEESGGAPPLDTNETETGAPAVEGTETEAPRSYVDPSVLHESRIAELEEELEMAKDRHLRALAEAENTRRRAQRDRDDGAKYAAVPLARDLLPVYDNLHRALKSVSEEQRAAASDLITGLELVEREFLNAFNKHKIAAIEPEVGERFDVNRHQAMFEAPIPGTESGSIIEVISTGFMCHDRLVRAAMVGVAKAAPATDTGASEDAAISGGST